MSTCTVSTPVASPAAAPRPRAVARPMRPPVETRVRDRVRDGLAVIAFSAATSVALAAGFGLLISVLGS